MKPMAQFGQPPERTGVWRVTREASRRAVTASLLACLALPGCATINTRLAMNEGVSHYKSKEYEKAVVSFKRAITISPEYPEAYLDLGLTYMELYEPGSEHTKDKEYAEGAIEAFKKYVRLVPENDKGREYLINICKISNRMPDAIDFFLVDYEKDQQNINLVKMMAVLYRYAGDMPKSIEFFEKAAQLEPSPEAFYSVGVACWGQSYNSPYLPYEERLALLDKGLAAMAKARAAKADYFEAITYESLLFRQKAQYDISPAEAVKWTQQADQLLAKAMELRNASLKAAAAAAASQGGAAPASGTAGTTPVSQGSQ